jgi:hypothetical protein
VLEFVRKDFEEIESSGYRMERETEEMEEDRLMATRVEAMVGVLEGLISIHFTQERTNLYNLEFLILFPT